jgi:hypothetical protein
MDAMLTRMNGMMMLTETVGIPPAAKVASVAPLRKNCEHGAEKPVNMY